MTQHFSFEELTLSSTAIAKKLDNTPDEEAAACLKCLAENVLEPLREAFGAPLHVSSAFRSKAVNKAVGGSLTSQHLKGQAADIKAQPLPGEAQRSANIRLFNIAKELMKEGKLKVGQLIDERNYSWIHISSPDERHNNQILHLK